MSYVFLVRKAVNRDGSAFPRSAIGLSDRWLFIAKALQTVFASDCVLGSYPEGYQLSWCLNPLTVLEFDFQEPASSPVRISIERLALEFL